MAKKKDTKKAFNNEAVKVLVRNGVLKSLREVFDMVKLTNVAQETTLHYSTLSKIKNHPETIKAEVFVILAELFGLSPQEVFTLALHDMGHIPPKAS